MNISTKQMGDILNKKVIVYMLIMLALIIGFCFGVVLSNKDKIYNFNKKIKEVNEFLETPCVTNCMGAIKYTFNGGDLVGINNINLT